MISKEDLLANLFYNHIIRASSEKWMQLIENFTWNCKTRQLSNFPKEALKNYATIIYNTFRLVFTLRYIFYSLECKTSKEQTFNI